MTESMRNALKGQGGGLQSASTAIGNLVMGGSDVQDDEQKKAGDATSSAAEMQSEGEKSGTTAEDSAIKAEDQIANQQTGTADHLNLGSQK